MSEYHEKVYDRLLSSTYRITLHRGEATEYPSQDTSQQTHIRPVFESWRYHLSKRHGN